MGQHNTQVEAQRGIATLALVLILVPLLIVVGSYLQTMSGRNSRLQLEIKEERAMMVAESGIDVALFEARKGTLVAGHQAKFSFAGAMPGGGDYSANCTYLGDDDIDNDNDGLIDEPDEDVYRVVSTGRVGGSLRRVAAYLGFSSFLAGPQSAITVTNQTPTDIRISGTPVIDGRNYSLAGNLVGSGNTFGIAIAAPATTTKLSALLTPAEGARVLGKTAAPSLGQTTTYTTTTVASTVAQARNAAQIVVTNGVAAAMSWGNATTGPQYIVYREGNLKVTGNTTGAGILVVNGDLTISGTLTWYGVVLVTGNFDCGSGTARIYGATVLGQGGIRVDVRGTCDLRYSQAAVALATRLTGRYVAFNGWQEISTN
jgi:hypothetical protein